MRKALLSLALASTLMVAPGLTPAERELVGRTLERRVFQRGEIVIKEGDTDRSLFMISKGTASVKVTLAGQGRRHFGECLRSGDEHAVGDAARLGPIGHPHAQLHAPPPVASGSTPSSSR